MLELKGLQPFGEICAHFSGLIADKAVKCRIEEKKLLLELEESFRPQAPDILKEEEVLDLLGMKLEAWRWVLGSKAWTHLRPNLVSKGVYWGPDILRLGKELKAHGWIELNSSWVLREFGLHIETYSKAFESRISMIRVKPSATSKSDLPSDYNDMARKYQTYIYDQVRRVSAIKHKEELEDVYQHVWMSLMTSDILTKFRTTAEHVLPSTLTFQEVLDFLGLTEEQWRREIANKGQWVPAPLSGSLREGDALFLTSDIQTLDVSGFLTDERGERKRPTVTGRGFKSYLTRAIQNHFKNLLRTRFRRHKERSVDSTRNSVSMTSAGSCSKTRAMEDAGSWEDNITDEWSNELPMEDMVDLSLQLQAYDLNPTMDENLDVLDTFLRGGVTLKDSLKKHKRTLRPVAA